MKSLLSIFEQFGLDEVIATQVVLSDAGKDRHVGFIDICEGVC